jgi:hypothetical protein
MQRHVQASWNSKVCERERERERERKERVADWASGSNN